MDLVCTQGYRDVDSTCVDEAKLCDNMLYIPYLPERESDYSGTYERQAGAYAGQEYYTRIRARVSLPPM